MQSEEKNYFQKEINYLNNRISEYEQKFLKFDDNVFAREKIIKETLGLDANMKINELKGEIERLKELGIREKELVEKRCQTNFESMKNSYEQVET